MACFLVGLDGARKDVPETWVSKVTLPVLFRSWCNSTDCHVAWLASLAADLFEQWSNEVDGIIGRASSPVVPYLITRSLAVDMAARSAQLGGAGLVV